MEPPTVQKNKIECKMTFRNEEPHVNKGFPRIRGDVPELQSQLGGVALFSPHTRGCSAVWEAARAIDPVFPAYAGMFLLLHMPCGAAARFPRIRGDVPVPAEASIIL